MHIYEYAYYDGSLHIIVHRPIHIESLTNFKAIFYSIYNINMTNDKSDDKSGNR